MQTKFGPAREWHEYKTAKIDSSGRENGLRDSAASLIAFSSANTFPHLMRGTWYFVTSPL